MIDEALKLSVIRVCARSGEARRIRLRALLSLDEMARSVGVDASTLSRWETGQASPRASAALRWFDLLERLSDRSEIEIPTSATG